MPVNKAQIIIADDHELFRDGLKTIIELSHIGDVIGDVSNGKELMEILAQSKPDLIIMDIDMPLMNGIQSTIEALKIYPNLNVLVVTMFSDKQYYIDMISAGAKGFILKTSNKNELQTAITTVIKGGNYFSNELLDDMVKHLNAIDKNSKPSNEKIFTEKDIEILNLMLQGLSTKEIANQSHLSTKTVSNYKALMLDKTGCTNAISLIIFAIKHNAVQI